MMAAIYARVSTDEQAEKYGLSSQLTELRALAAGKGYTIPEGADFVDDGYSGADLDRPALNRLREAVRARAIDVVLIHDPDRLARRLAHQLLLIEEIEQAGTAIEWGSGPRQKTLDGQLLDNIRGVIAEYERGKIAERTQRGRRERARRGLVSIYPYGYRPDPANPGRPKIEESEAATVRMIYSWLVDEQLSVRAIVRELRALGVPGQRAASWGPTSVRRLLNSPYYAGRTWYNRHQTITPAGGARRVDRLRPENEWIPIDVPAIIAPARFAAGQRQLAHNRTWLVGRPATTRVYLLRGLLRCGECGRTLVGDGSRRRAAYRCHGRSANVSAAPGVARCGTARLGVRVAESVVWDTVVAILRDPALIETKLAERETRAGVRDVEVRSELAHLEREAARLARDENRILELYLAEDLDVSGLRERLTGVRRRRKAVADRLERMRTVVAGAGADQGSDEAIQQACAQALRGLDRLDAKGRQALLDHLVEKILVRGRTLEIHGILPGGELLRASSRQDQYPVRRYLVSVPVGGRR